MIVAGEVAQEQEDHHHDQRDREHQLELHVATEARMVTVRSVSSVDIDGGRQRRLQLRQQLLDAVDDLDHVGAGLALDVDDHRAADWFAHAASRVFSAPSITSATSDRRTGAPLR